MAAAMLFVLLLLGHSYCADFIVYLVKF
uniref:Uncharacterized protein n=1 Tax=Arundo donax TaxID=35708 RepID=A0A0A8Z9M6_ARUDO